MKVNGENDDEEDGHNNGKPLRSPTDDESELGLAYADSEDDQQHVVHTSPRRNPSGASSSSAYSRGGGGAGLDNAMEALLRSPGSSSADLDFDVPIVPPTPTNNGFGIGAGAGAGGSPGLKPVKLPVRSHTSPSQRDSARVASGGVGGAAALNVGLNGARRGGTISGAIGGGHGHGHHGHGHDDDDATSVAESEVAAGKKASVSTGTSGSSSSSSRKPRVRDCVRCGKRIEDGRWIRVESGKGVLCDRCWKNMYLPKVSSRRLFYVKRTLACVFFSVCSLPLFFSLLRGCRWLRCSPWRLGSPPASLNLLRTFLLFLRLRPSLRPLNTKH